MTGSNATNASELSVSDITTLDGEPRIEDLRIADRLGFDRPRNIRKLIDRNKGELETYGEVRSTVERTSAKGGRPGGRAYHLNEGQTLLVCMLARTPRAAAVRKEVIDAYMAFRHRRQCLPAGGDRRDGSGMVVIGGELILFDDKIRYVEDGDSVVGFVDRGAGKTPELVVVQATIGPDPYREQRHGFRTILSEVEHSSSVVTAQASLIVCLALGRVISRTLIEPDGGAA